MIYPRILAAWARVAGRPCFRRLNNLLANLGAWGLGIGNPDSQTNGEVRYLRRWLRHRSTKAGPVVLFDVGANVGDFSETVSSLCPDAIIHAFEPHPRTHARLEKRFAGRGIFCHNMAIGSRTEILSLWDYADVPEGSAHATFHPEAIKITSDAVMTGIDVPVRTIDELASAHSIESIALLKLDVEGHELSCLEGAVGLLRKSAIELIQFEFNAMHLEARVNMGDFARRLDGFELFRIQPGGLMRLDLRDMMLSNLYAMQNILAVRRPFEVRGGALVPN